MAQAACGNDALVESVRSTTIRELDLHEWGLGRLSLSSTSDRQRLIEVLIGHAKYLPPHERTDFVKTIQGRVRVSGAFPALMMTSAQVRALHAAGMDIGGHTITHPILTGVAHNECMREIQGGRDCLEEIIDAPWIALPIRMENRVATTTRATSRWLGSSASSAP
jgi:hypothetical protein